MRLLLTIFTLTTMWDVGAAEIRVTPQTAPDHAARHNRALAAARLQVAAAEGRLKQSGRLSNPEIEFEARHNPSFDEGAIGIGFTQRFPLTNRLRLEKDVSRAELRAAMAEVQEAERRLRLAAETATIKLLAIEGQMALRQTQLRNSREAAEVTTKRAAVGEASTADALQFELEAQQLETERLQLDVERAALQGELRPLLGLRSADTLRVTGSLSSTVNLPGKPLDVSRRPDVISAREMAEAADRGVSLARANRWEDASAGLVAEGERSMDEPEGLQNEAMVGIRFSLPLPLWNKNEGRIDEAIANAKRARLEIDARVVEASGEATGARGEMQSLVRVIREMDAQLLPKARDLEERLRQVYAAGQGSLTDVLRATERRLQLESRRLDALRDYHLARARFHAALGLNLSRK